MDDSTDADRRLSALADFIAAAEAEVLRLLQVERDAEARLAHLRLTPPVLLWPEGVTLAVNVSGRRAELVADPIPVQPEPRRTESRPRREPAPMPEPAPAQPMPLPPPPPPVMAAAPAMPEPATVVEKLDPADPLSHAESIPAEPVADELTHPITPVVPIPAAGLRRPKNLIEAWS